MEVQAENIECMQLLQSPTTNITNENIVVDNSNQTIVVATKESRKFSQQEKFEYVQKFIEKVKNTSKNKIELGVVADYKSLREPDFEVCPVMLDVDFYRGENAADEPEYAPESNFSRRTEKMKGNPIELSKLHTNLDKKRNRHVSIVGGAGSGKTTLLRRYARDVMEGNIFLGKPDQNVCLFSFRRRQRSQLVHFINVRELPLTGTFKPADLLFKVMVRELDEAELQEGYNRLKNYHENCVFVIDGLDQYDWKLENESQKIDYETTASVPCIIFNLLCGEIFPNAWILTSSRQHKIRFFQEKLRADKIVVLNGLERQDIKRLADELPRTDKTVWQRLSERCPNLLIMCKTPLFLIITILVFVLKKDFSLDTMAGVMTVFIQSFVECSHAKVGDLKSILGQLKKLAFKGTLEKRVIFTEDDFNYVGLRSEDAQDLVIFAPRQTSIIRREQLLSNDYVMFFCHQSIQETLAMLWIVEMEYEEFASFVENNINTPHFSVVRRLLSGFLLNSKTYEAGAKLSVVSRREEKMAFLLSCLEKALHTKTTSTDYMELLASLYEAESGADSLVTGLQEKIAVTRIHLTTSDVYVLANIIGRMSVLENLEIWDTKMDQEKIAILQKELEKSNTKIKRLDVHSNYGDDIGCGNLGDIIHHCEVEDLDINDCNLTDNKLKMFSSSQNWKLKKLAVSKNPDLGAIGFSIIGNLVKNSGEFEELRIDKCDLSTKKIKALKQSLSGTKINFLDINYNRKMGKKGACLMGKLIRESTVTCVNMSRCDQSSNEILSFAEGMRKYKLKKLDITTHELTKSITKPYVKALSKLLPCVTDEIKMIDWKIDEEHRNMIQKDINETSSLPEDFRLIYGPFGRHAISKSDSS